MAISPEGGTAAYAPATAVTKTIDRYREVGFAGQPLSDVTLRKIGISDSLIPRTLASLRVLDLIDEDGKPTDQFDVLKNAPGTEFHARLAEWLKDTYAPIFGFCDPTVASADQIEDAFRGYTPEGQRTRMANLFMGLAEYAGIVAAPPAKPRGRHASPTNKSPTRKKTKEHTSPEPNRDREAVSRVAPSGVEAQRQRYLDLLIAKAETQDTPDAELLDRIERALGIAPKQGASP